MKPCEPKPHSPCHQFLRVFPYPAVKTKESQFITGALITHTDEGVSEGEMNFRIKEMNKITWAERMQLLQIIY